MRPHVPVAAERRVAAPLVAGESDETAFLVEGARDGVDAAPELVGDLEIVPLVAGDVEQGVVARETEVVLDGVRPYGLL